MFQRHLSAYIHYAARYYPIVTITGPRQSGKTTLARMLFPEKPYVSLEDLDMRDYAKTDPRGFLATYSKGAIFDEIQHCPHLFSYLQTKTDLDRIPGQFILTGSQNFLLFEGISQSLAGRAAIAYLLPLSLSEIETEVNLHSNPFHFVFRGFYPKLYQTDLAPSTWYSDYIRTYVERDLRMIKNITDLSAFQLFLKLCAGRIGQLLNLSSLGSECGVSYNTIRSWLSILQTSFIVFTLKPHHKNFNKRLVKQEKIYFYDTGLACSLLNIESEQQLETHSMRGSLFENMIIADLLKARWNKGKESNLYFWRDHHGHELDVIIEGDPLIPVEIKSGQTVTSDFLKGVNYWMALSGEKEGYIVYGGGSEQIRKGVTVLPWSDTNKIKGVSIPAV